MKYKTLILAVAISATLSACSPSTDHPTTPEPDLNTPSDAIKVLEDRGEIPKLDTSDDLAGPDSNNDGIRDDIGEWINTVATTTDQQRDLRHVARTIQIAILSEPDNEQELAEIGRQMALNTVCMRQSFTDYESRRSVLEEVQAFTANTEARAFAYQAYNEARDGSVGILPSTSECEGR